MEVRNQSQQTTKKRISKTWEAAMRLKGSIIVIDKTILS